MNTAFGYGVYALLLFLGITLFLAQLAAHIIGSCFNYFTVSRHVFRGRRGSIWSFGGSYALNYLIALAFLAFFHLFIASDYIAGMLAAAGASFINFLVLNTFIFPKVRTAE